MKLLSRFIMFINFLILSACGSTNGSHNAGDTFRDCAECPEMVVIPNGSFMMGSNDGSNNENPLHKVTILAKFAVGKFEVTRAQYVRFARSTGRSSDRGCWLGGMKTGNLPSWLNPGFNQTENHPVVCVKWDDAKAYTKWFSRETGQQYRLLSESEWEYVARAGTKTKYSFGNSISYAQANFGRNVGKTIPVGMFPENGFGVHDMHGNVSEWVEDCYEDNYHSAPSDGSAIIGDSTCPQHVLRGGSWDDIRELIGSSFRNRKSVDEPPSNLNGFRIARSLSTNASKSTDVSSTTYQIAKSQPANASTSTDISSAIYQKGYDAYKNGNYPAALKEWISIAEMGHAEAKYSLGFMYSRGFGVLRDSKVAFKWFKLAAEQGHVKSQNNLGYMYQRGHGVLLNSRAAVIWFKLSAEQGHVTAQHNLGFMYGYGRGVPRNKKEASKWNALAADQGYKGTMWVEEDGLPLYEQPN